MVRLGSVMLSLVRLSKVGLNSNFLQTLILNRFFSLSDSFSH
jgi:hypothetical protein